MQFIILGFIFPYIAGLICFGISRYFQIPLYKLALGYTALVVTIGSLALYLLNNIVDDSNNNDFLSIGLLFLIPFGIIVIQILFFWNSLFLIFKFNYCGKSMLSGAYKFFTENKKE